MSYMKNLTLVPGTVEFVTWTLRSTEELSGVLQFAFLPLTEFPTTSTTWIPGVWTTTQLGAPGRVTREASLLIEALTNTSPSAVKLSHGTWGVWIRLSDNPESVVRPAGAITVEHNDEIFP